MARTVKDFGTKGEAIWADCQSKGLPIAVAAARLKAAGVSVGLNTLYRREKREKGLHRKAHLAKRGAPVEPESLPEPTEESVPSHADVTYLDYWLERMRLLGEQAERDGNAMAAARAGSVTVALLEHKRKLEPPVFENPNELPDMIRLGKDVQERLTKIVKALM